MAAHQIPQLQSLPSPCTLLLNVNFQRNLLSGWWVGGGVLFGIYMHRTRYPRLGQACFFLHRAAEDRGAERCRDLPRVTDKVQAKWS